MPTHITARLAWHSDGWNGAICKAPEQNSYCVGCKSFPGDVIARERNLELEKKHAGQLANKLKGYVPPCGYSYNAFGLETAPASSTPPDFFFGGAERHEWTLPPATVCVWPYEAMYAEEVKASGYLDNDRRRQLTLEFFKPIQADCGSNLIFYYANYSNPLSDEESPRYAIVGVSRIVNVGDELFYNNVTPQIAEKYAGGMIWARDITAAYPNEGIRLPYHRYRDDPERLAEIAVYPENPALCKYGSKHISDDEAIGLLEQFLAKIRLLKEIGDSSEDWSIREEWLLQTIAKLWTHRGLYPGLLKALDAAGAGALIDGAKSLCLDKGHEYAHATAFEAIEGTKDNVLTAALDPTERKRISRSWKLLDEGARKLLRDVLPRIDLSKDAMSAIALPENRENCGIAASAEEIISNPYILSEQYCGDSPEDRIGWSVIDRGVLPAPEVGGKPLADVQYNDERRFRALCVEHLRREPNHTFRFSRDLVVEITERMDRLPAWKQAQFTERYFEVDAEFLSGALFLDTVEPGLAVYLKIVHEDERSVASVLSELASRPDIDLRRPVTTTDWTSWIRKDGSALATKGGEQYASAVQEQVETCERLFRHPLSVVTGAAGTGKTTVIEALVRAVRRSEGEGASILVLAPTGKAADRAREIFEVASLDRVETVTVHSFLASNGWLNDNLTLKRSGGKRAAVGTLILDEASMLDLELAAALLRAVDWRQVRRLILVGDPGQLPPIGRGRVFADIIKWLSAEYPSNLGRLKRNLRQLLNRVRGDGSAIMALSELFIVNDEDKSEKGSDDATRPDQEQLIERIHAGGDVDHDLNVIFWNEPTELAQILLNAVEERMRKEVSSEGTAAPYQLWRAALGDDPTKFQILTPHRGEAHGVEAINEACQKRISDNVIKRISAVDGITLGDKVIQVRNRPKSNPIWAYDANKREQIKVEVFNGEIGIVQTFGFDSKVWQTLKTGYGPRLKRFAVQFTRKPGITVGYGKDVPAGGKYSRTEKVDENLELAYAVSIHKAQGSEFARTFVVVPASSKRPVSTEMIYTALTRASRHCTLLLEKDVTSLLDARRRENAQTPQINSSLFTLHVAKTALRDRRSWYEAGKIHMALSGDILRSKSEVIIANLLHDRDMPFKYEQPLFAGDGTLRLPDFTVGWGGKTYFWEHLGRLDLTDYAEEWQNKKAWYERWFPGQLITTEEGAQLSKDAASLIEKIVSGAI